MQFNWAEKTCRRFASDEIKALINKLDTDDEFRKNYFEGATDNRTITASYILRGKDSAYELSLWDDRYAYHALRRIRSEYKIRKTKDTMLHIVMDTLKDEESKTQAAPPIYKNTNPFVTTTQNSSLQALAQQYAASQQQLNQQLGQKPYP